MKNISLSTLISLFTLISLDAQATAGQVSTDGGKQCAESVRRCFDFAEDARVTCLYETQELSFCDGSTAQGLVELRLGLQKSPGKEQRSTYIVDGRCVERCDYQFVRTLINGDLDQGAASIRSCYENCKVDERRPMLRP